MPDTPTPEEHVEADQLESVLEALEQAEPSDAPEAAEAVAAALQHELDRE